MTGGVLMSKNNLLLGFILGVLGTFFLENDKTFAGNELGE